MMSIDPSWDAHDDGDGGGGLGFLAPLRDPIGLFQRQRVWIIASLTLCLLATGATAKLFPLTYEARGTILLSAKSIPDEFVPTTIIANILEQFEAIRGTVFSRDTLTKIIIDTDLYLAERDSAAMSTLATRLSTEVQVTRLGGPIRGRTTPSAVAFEVTMSGNDPKLVTTVVNATVSELINANLEYRSKQARVTTDFMRREFNRADDELRKHQRALAEFRAKSRGALPEEQEAALSKLERLEDQRRSSILQVTDYRSRMERIDARPTEIGTQLDVESIRARLENARGLYTADHPTVLSLERQLSAMTAARDGQTGPRVNGAAAEERSAIQSAIGLEQDRLRQIDAAVERLEGFLASAPEISEDYSALIRREQILQENYVEYLRKLKSAELALSLESAQQGAQLVRTDSAIPPQNPVIQRWAIALAGVMVSLVAALAVGVLREILFSVIVDEAHLESIVPIPCIGSISKVA